MEIPFHKLNKGSYGEASRNQIDEWKSRAIELAEQENFRLHPVTIKLVKEAEQQVEIIENKLKNEEDLSDLERKSLFKEKKVHQFYLQIFKRDGSSELELIAKNVEDEINQ